MNNYICGMISIRKPSEILDEAWEDYKVSHPFETFTDNDKRMFESGYKTAYVKATNQFLKDIFIYHEQDRTNKTTDC